MARPRNHDKHIRSALQELLRSATKLVEAVAVSLNAQSAATGARGSQAKARPAKAKSGKPSPGRLRQIEAMKAYWAKKNAAKAK